MKSQQPHRIRIFEINSRAVTIALTLTLLFALIAVVTPAAQAQQYTYIDLHNFTGGQDGGTPKAGVTIDAAGNNLYGTTYGFGAHDYGTVYQLKIKGGIVNPLYSFTGGEDGANPLARVIFGPGGGLYGTTSLGGTGAGTVFELRPPASAPKTAVFPWGETVLYSFKAGADGAYPGYGDLTFDRAGNIYDTTIQGGNPYDVGTAYELTPSGGGYTEVVLYSFGGGSDGIYPYGGVILDSAGNLYGTTYDGGIHADGTVFQLMPPSGGGNWTENLLHSFDGSDGAFPLAGLIRDPSGNLYGVTTFDGPGGGGEVFEMTDVGNNNWSYTPIYGLTGGGGCGPYHSLVMDGKGNLYGATYCDGANGFGNVFELTPANGGWTYTDLYDFTGGNDGAYPITQVTLDGSGNLYGTASAGGLQGVGVVWELKKN